MTEADVEYERRKDRIDQRALEKYGPNALSPKGIEEFDAIDFALNELVGIERYCEMIRNRLVSTTMEYQALMLCEGLLAEVESSARVDAYKLIELRARVQQSGHSLGQKTEFEL